MRYKFCWGGTAVASEHLIRAHNIIAGIFPSSAKAMESNPPTQDDSGNGKRAGRIFAKLGMAGVLFFLIKGVLWLTIPALLVSMGVQCSP